MFWLILILFLLVLGYGFFECGRYVAVRRNPNPEFPYSRERLARRLVIAALVQAEILLIAARLFWLKGSMSQMGIMLYTTLSVAIVVVVFYLLWRDLREVRMDIRSAKNRYKRELIEEISDLCTRSNDSEDEVDSRL